MEYFDFIETLIVTLITLSVIVVFQKRKDILNMYIVFVYDHVKFGNNNTFLDIKESLTEMFSDYFFLYKEM